MLCSQVADCNAGTKLTTIFDMYDYEVGFKVTVMSTATGASPPCSLPTSPRLVDNLLCERKSIDRDRLLARVLAGAGCLKLDAKYDSTATPKTTKGAMDLYIVPTCDATEGAGYFKVQRHLDSTCSSPHTPVTDLDLSTAKFPTTNLFNEGGNAFNALIMKYGNLFSLIEGSPAEFGICREISEAYRPVSAATYAKVNFIGASGATFAGPYLCWRENQPSPPPSTPPPPPMPTSLCPALDRDLGLTNILSNVEFYSQTCGAGFDDSTCNGLLECVSKMLANQPGGVVTSTGWFCGSAAHCGDQATGKDWQHICSWPLDNPPGGVTGAQQGLRAMWGSAGTFWPNVTGYMAADSAISRLGDICVGTCASVGASYTVDGVTKTPACPSPPPPPSPPTCATETCSQRCSSIGKAHVDVCSGCPMPPSPPPPPVSAEVTDGKGKRRMDEHSKTSSTETTEDSTAPTMQCHAAAVDYNMSATAGAEAVATAVQCPG